METRQHNPSYVQTVGSKLEETPPSILFDDVQVVIFPPRSQKWGGYSAS